MRKRARLGPFHLRADQIWELELKLLRPSHSDLPSLFSHAVIKHELPLPTSSPIDNDGFGCRRDRLGRLGAREPTSDARKVMQLSARH